MSNFNVNIGIEDVLAQKEKEIIVNKPKTAYNEKNYLQARLTNGETSKEMTIRLLPYSPEGGSPFHKIYMHTVRVNKEVSQGGWKTFPCPIHNHLGEKCPFCETAEQAKSLKKQAVSESEKKKYNEVEFSHQVKEMWVVRCIERGHEDDGVKFWTFPHSKKGNGVWDKIMNIFQTRYNKAALQGKKFNIFDLNEGKDLVLTLSKDSMGKTVIQIADDDERTPLSVNYEKAVAWINDGKKWEEVYTVKSYDYMSIIVQGGVPVFSKEKNTYIDKIEANIEAEAEIEANLTRSTVDLSNPTQIFGNPIEVNGNNGSDDDEDLPF